ncbi:hypothetical protein Ahy_A03g011481 [Arachis hypogaea]|uniref:Uncharacterized protein n=1 Tax=Arachis hypogaea TaxID=3818 RepID=A0A445DQU7_ARAHY|nr:hypothetical protein Ahy_A03g011481 [Arachis hypogaea]
MVTNLTIIEGIMSFGGIKHGQHAIFHSYPSLTASVQSSTAHVARVNNVVNLTCENCCSLSVFQRLGDATKFYKDYSKAAGFSTRVRSTNKKSNEIKNQLITCSR